MYKEDARTLLSALLVIVGVATMLYQTFREAPWQFGFALGLLLAVAGGVGLADSKEEDEEPEELGRYCEPRRSRL